MSVPQPLYDIYYDLVRISKETSHDEPNEDTANDIETLLNKTIPDFDSKDVDDIIMVQFYKFIRKLFYTDKKFALEMINLKSANSPYRFCPPMVLWTNSHYITEALHFIGRYNIVWNTADKQYNVKVWARTEKQTQSVEDEPVDKETLEKMINKLSDKPDKVSERKKKPVVKTTTKSDKKTTVTKNIINLKPVRVTKKTKVVADSATETVEATTELVEAAAEPVVNSKLSYPQPVEVVVENHVEN